MRRTFGRCVAAGLTAVAIVALTSQTARADEAVRLFERACIASLPDFQGALGVFENAGFFDDGDSMLTSDTSSVTAMLAEDGEDLGCMVRAMGEDGADALAGVAGAMQRLLGDKESTYRTGGGDASMSWDFPYEGRAVHVVVADDALFGPTLSAFSGRLGN